MWSQKSSLRMSHLCTKQSHSSNECVTMFGAIRIIIQGGTKPPDTNTSIQPGPCGPTTPTLTGILQNAT